MSLPYNMRGSIAITDISDVLTELAKAEANLGDDGAEVSPMGLLSGGRARNGIRG